MAVGLSEGCVLVTWAPISEGKKLSLSSIYTIGAF